MHPGLRLKCLFSLSLAIALSNVRFVMSLTSVLLTQILINLVMSFSPSYVACLDVCF